MMRIFFSSMFIFALLFPQSSFALQCQAIINGKKETQEIVDVDDIIIPESSKNGEVIWSSPEYTREVICDKADLTENVYFYPFPNVKPSSLPSGMSFGLIYQGKSYDLSTSTEKIKTDIVVPKNGEKTGSIKVQIYIKKTGNITGGYMGGLPIYQLDGQGGLNNSPSAKNFKFYLSNLGNIATGTCSHSLSGIPATNVITINDNLVSNGQIITSMGSASVSCTPVNLLKNRTVKMNFYTKNSSGNSLFGTDKNGIGYSLLISGKSILPSTSSSSPVIISFNLDTNGKGSQKFDQKILLTSTNEEWLYKNEVTTAKSNNPNLDMSINSFE